MTEELTGAGAPEGPRLYLNEPLASGAEIGLGRDASNYLIAVMRLGEGAVCTVFNGEDGEWRAQIATAHKRAAQLRILEQRRPAAPPPDLWLLFAPIKKARTDFIVEKATELGCRRILPITTRRTQSERVNLERLQAHAIEAAEQCELVFAPDVAPPQRLDDALASWDPARRLFFCDEARDARPMSEAVGAQPHESAAILIGPEGGFTPEEREKLLRQPFVTPATLGPRILRADTAAAAAVSIWQDVQGDWRGL
ncbi:MAG: 16S rRNA (uracil(1498)-N(3))-methyltransferase [Neomegalonema sp.]|nr:16S rRNA (uracil(1498)-N(3))-methyltransferase [Neomegalonema sp.]